MATLALTRRRPTLPVLLVAPRQRRLLAHLAAEHRALRPGRAAAAGAHLRRRVAGAAAAASGQGGVPAGARRRVQRASPPRSARCSWSAWRFAGGTVAGVEVVPARFDPKVFPVDAVAKARAERLEGTLFNNFIWGGYLLHAWPEQAGVHRRRHRPLRRQAVRRVRPGLESRAGLAGRHAAPRHRPGARAAGSGSPTSWWAIWDGTSGTATRPP